MKDAVHQLLQQKKEEKEHNRADQVATRARAKRRGLTRYLQATALLGVLVIAVIMALPQWREPFKPPTGLDAERHARQAIVFAASLVEAYERRTGRPPGNLSQVGVSLPDIRLDRTGETSYSLSMRVEGRDITFQKGDDKTRFLNTP